MEPNQQNPAPAQPNVPEAQQAQVPTQQTPTPPIESVTAPVQTPAVESNTTNPLQQPPQPVPSQSFVGGVDPGPIAPAQAQTSQLFASSPLSASNVAASSKKKRILLIGIVLAVLLLAAGGVFLIRSMMAGNLALKTHESEKFSILYPSEGYKVEDSALGLEIKEEAGEDDEQSYIQVESYPSSGTSDEEKKNLLTRMKESMSEESLKTSVGSGGEIKNFKSEIRDHEGRETLFVSAQVTEKDSKDSTISLRAFASGDRLYAVVIGAHGSDQGLIKNVNKIHDSFKVK